MPRSELFYHNELVTVKGTPGVFCYYSPAPNPGWLFLSPGNKVAEQLTSTLPYGLLVASRKSVTRYHT